MVKSIYLNYSEQVAGNKPFKFVVPLDETLKLMKGELVGLHNVSINRPLIVLDSDQQFTILLNQNIQLNTEYDWLETPLDSRVQTATEVNNYENSTEFMTFSINPYYRLLLPNVTVTIPAGTYNKNSFLQILEFKANSALLQTIKNPFPQFYFPYRFAVVNDGEKNYLGLFNFSSQVPFRFSSTSDEHIPGLINYQNLNDDNLTSILVADFAIDNGNLAYPSEMRYLVNNEISINLVDDSSTTIWDTFGFGNSSINLLNNKQDTETDRQNSSLTFGIGVTDAGNEEYYAGCLSQLYQMKNWTSPDVVQSVLVNSLNTTVPATYCGLYFKNTPDGLILHVLGCTNPYYAVDTFTIPPVPGEDPPDPPTDRFICYRNSITPIANMMVLYSTIIPTATSVKNKNMFGIEFYYRYTTNSKTLVYKNLELEGDIFNIPLKPENFRLYFRVITTGGIDSKTNNRTIFDSRSIDYYFSHEMLIDNYGIFDPENYPSSVLKDGNEIKRNLLANTGLAGGMVPFIACRNVDDTGETGFYNMTFNPTRLFDYEQSEINPDGTMVEYGYYPDDLADKVNIACKFDYLPVGIFSYGFTDMSDQISKVLGTSAFDKLSKINKSLLLDPTIYGGFTTARFPFDINSELGITKIFTEGNKYHIIIKNIPLAALANVKDTGNAKRQNIVYTLRQSDSDLTNIETNSLEITHYPNFIKYLSMYNNNEVNINFIEVEIRNAETGKYAEEITDCSLEILFSNS
jgi:hypothetical protein